MNRKNICSIFGVFLAGILFGFLLTFSPKVIASSNQANSSGLGGYLQKLETSLNNLWHSLNNKKVEQKSSLNSSNNSLNKENKNSQLKGSKKSETKKTQSFGYTEHERRVIAVVKQASPAVVSIIISKYIPVVERYYTNPFGNLPPEFQPFFNFEIPQYKQKGIKKQEIGGGSGFIVSPDGLIVTNKHVVADKDASYTVLTNDGKRYNAKVLARDSLKDVAILKINAKNLPTLQLGDSDNIMMGQTVIAIGNALGEFRNTVSVGVVSGLSRTITATGGIGQSETIQGVIQTDAAINHGNSGGPLLALNGKVIGINTAMAQGAENIGFAIPINQVKKDIESVEKVGKIITPYIGIRYVIINPLIKDKYNLPVDYGALIVSGGNDEPGVVPYSPAAKAGLKEGDVVLEINGQKIDYKHTITSIISNLSVGQEITLKIMRDKKIFTKKLILGQR